MMAMVPSPSHSASSEMPAATREGNSVIISIVITGDLSPTSGYSCCRMMMTPMPLIKPDRTG